jgi:hypothetical protein
VKEINSKEDINSQVKNIQFLTHYEMYVMEKRDPKNNTKQQSITHALN